MKFDILSHMLQFYLSIWYNRYNQLFILNDRCRQRNVHVRCDNLHVITRSPRHLSFHVGAGFCDRLRNFIQHRIQ